MAEPTPIIFIQALLTLILGVFLGDICRSTWCLCHELQRRAPSLRRQNRLREQAKRKHRRKQVKQENRRKQFLEGPQFKQFNKKFKQLLEDLGGLPARERKKVVRKILKKKNKKRRRRTHLFLPRPILVGCYVFLIAHRTYQRVKSIIGKLVTAARNAYVDGMKPALLIAAGLAAAAAAYTAYTGLRDRRSAAVAEQAGPVPNASGAETAH